VVVGKRVSRANPQYTASHFSESKTLRPWTAYQRPLLLAVVFDPPNEQLVEKVFAVEKQKESEKKKSIFAL